VPVPPLTEWQAAAVGTLLHKASEDNGWQTVTALKGLKVQSHSLIRHEGRFDISTEIKRTLYLFNAPVTEIGVEKYSLTLTKIVYLRNWDISKGDVAEMARGFPDMTEEKLSNLAIRIHSECSSLRRSIWEKNLIPFVETSVTQFNRATGIEDDASGDGDHAGGHFTVNSRYRRLSDEDRVGFPL
jgi:hypothetical protein